MPKYTGGKSARADFAAKQDAMYGQAEMVADRKFITRSVFVLPGPKGGLSEFRRLSNGGVAGYEKGYGVDCACTECKKVFNFNPGKDEEGRDQVKALQDGYSAEHVSVVAECPDCGAMSELKHLDMQFYAVPEELARKDSQDPKKTKRDTVHTEPVEYRIYENVGDRMTASVLYKGIRASLAPEADPATGKFNHDAAIVHEVEKITIDRSRRTIETTCELTGGLQKPAPHECRLYGVAMADSRDQMRNDDGLMFSGFGRNERHGYHSDDYVTQTLRKCNDEMLCTAHRKFCEGPYGLPPVRTEQFNTDEITRVTRNVCLAVQYPGVMQYEMDKCNENIKYQHPDATDEETQQLRQQTVDRMALRLSMMDNKITQALHKADTKEQALATLRGFTFGEKSSDVRGLDLGDANGVATKMVRKEFNKDPYTAAHNVYTARKLGVSDASALREVFERGEALADREHRPGRPAMVPPIESREAMVMIKQMAKTRTPHVLMEQVWQNATSVKTFSDAAAMLGDVTKGTGIARTKEELSEERVKETLNAVRTKLGEGASVAEIAANPAYQRVWGAKAEGVVGALAAEAKAHPQEEVMRALCRNGEALFPNRTLQEIHDELMVAQRGLRNPYTEENKAIRYPEEKLAKYETTIDGYSFKFMRDTAQIWDTGNEMNLCVGASHYRQRALNGSVNLMRIVDPGGRAVGCLEFDSSMSTINQAKAKKNHTIPYETGGKQLLQYLEERSIKPTPSGREDLDGIGKDIAMYGNMDFRTPEGRPVEHLRADPDASIPSVNEVMTVLKAREAQRAAQAAKEKAVETAIGLGGNVREQARQTEPLPGVN